MRNRVILTVVVLTVVLATALPISAAALGPGGTFRDDDGNVHEGGIEAIAAAGITKGCNPPLNDRYCPANSVTRGQMAAFLVRALDLPPAAADKFSDDVTSVFEDYINRLAAAGITKGCNPPVNDQYCPTAVVTREQMAAFLVRAVDEAEPPANYCSTGSPFSDVPSGHWACKYIKRLSELDITQGCGGNKYCPNDFVTRAQMAAFLARAFLGMD